MGDISTTKEPKSPYLHRRGDHLLPNFHMSQRQIGEGTAMDTCNLPWSGRLAFARFFSAVIAGFLHKLWKLSVVCFLVTSNIPEQLASQHLKIDTR